MHALTTNLPHLALPPKPTTHEEYIQDVRRLSLNHCNLSPKDTQRLASTKLTYGLAEPGVRGITHYNSWHHTDAHDFICIAASGEESHVQLMGTTLHELAHVLAGAPAGHSTKWKEAASQLGLVEALASGQDYVPDHFAPSLWTELDLLPTPSDGNPYFFSALFGPIKPRPCSLGIGTRGGKSRGKGSGSRLRKYICACGSPVVRVASDTWQATCDQCLQPFTLVPSK